MKRVLYALFYAALWSATMLAAAWTAIDIAGNARPPLQPADSTGSGFRVERGRQHVVHLEGDPYSLGFHNARLLGPLMRQQEDTLLDLLFDFAGGPVRAMLIRQLSLFYLAGLDDYLTQAEREEILGLANGHVDPFPDLGPRYGRIAAYHAIHELSQRFAVDNPFACSLLAVGKERGRDGHAYLARNFDFEGGDVFDRHKVVLAVRPSTGFGFVSVSWAGMAGVISGMNEHGLVVTINAAASVHYRRVGAPTSLLVRRALERARTIDEAIAVLTEQPRFVTDIIGMTDRTGRVAVLELTPEEYRLRDGDVLVATNHLESPQLADDPRSLERKAQTTTVPRHARLDRWLAENPDPLGPDDLLRALRDRSRDDGTGLPLGHRHSVDALIATHSVIFDATGGRVWVSEGPHTLGAYHGYDVASLLAADSPEAARAAFLPSLPADPLREAYPLIARARAAWKTAAAELDAGDLGAAERELRHTVTLADHPKSLWLRARLALARGDQGWARRFILQALATPPEYPVDRARLEALLELTDGEESGS